ncbi:hypothetical protein AMTRI_Chr13g88370 [Amborella trichopoda]
MDEIARQSICFFVIILLSFGHGVKGRRTRLGYKNAVKTIHSDVDLIDCVDIYKQPAFDHPLLKNHTIQMRPSWYLNWKSARKKQFQYAGLEEMTMIMLALILLGLLSRKAERIPFPKKDKYGNQNDKYAGMFLKDKDFYGAIQAITAWNPQFEVPTEYSAARHGSSMRQMWLEQDGWYVKPSLFGDNRTRLFVSWNKVGSQTTGCYNLFCPGFIQTNSKAVLGAYLSPITWSSAEDINIGYWPASVFTNLQVPEAGVGWTSNGHFPEDSKEAAYFKDLKVVDDIYDFTDDAYCYDSMPMYVNPHGYYFGGPVRGTFCK